MNGTSVFVPKPKLARFNFRHYISPMSTVELLNHVKTLPSRERRKFVTAVLAMESTPPSRRSPKTKRVKWPDVEARAKRIFGDRMLPNLVLLERREEAH